jgi:hypothetical protein
MARAMMPLSTGGKRSGIIAAPYALPPEQQHGGRVEQQRHDQDEVAHCLLVSAAEQSREIAHRPQVGLDRLSLAVHLRLFDADSSP